MKATKPKSMRETLQDNAKAHAFLAAQMGKEVPEQFKAPEAVQRKERVKSEIPTESEEQRLFVKWFRQQYPKVLIHSIPNGSHLAGGYISAGKLTAEGMVPGMPDLCIPAWDLYIEFKRIKGSVTSDEQKDIAAQLLAMGKKHFFAFGFDDARIKLQLTIDKLVTNQ